MGGSPVGDNVTITLPAEYAAVALASIHGSDPDAPGVAVLVDALHKALWREHRDLLDPMVALERHRSAAVARMAAWDRAHPAG